jgi:integrase
MTIYFEQRRSRWVFDFVKHGRRHYGYCLDAAGEPVKSKSAARQAEAVEKRRVELEPKVAPPGEMTVAMAVAALVSKWQLQANWPARRTWIRELIGFFGVDTAIASIDQARVDDYEMACRRATVKIWKGGPTLDSKNPANDHYWQDTGKPRSVATVNLYLGTLREIFGRADAQRDANGDKTFKWLPTVKDIRRPKRKARPMPSHVSGEIMSIMPSHVIDAMMLTAMFGFRRGEAFTLQRSQIDWDHKGVRLLAENVKDAEDVFLPASQFAMGYLRCLDMAAEARGSAFLVTWQPKADGPWLAIKKPRAAWSRARSFMQAHYGRTWRWHDLRGAFISQVAMESGGVVAQTLARHSDFSTTQLYIEVADEMRRMAADRIGQRALLLGQIESPRQNSQTAQFAPSQGRKKSLKIWSEREDSNLRPLRPERSALPG